jgi:hypothetical protein
MNYFAHALPFLDDDPYFVAGTGVPDWLTVADRRVRVRLKQARPFTHDPDRRVAAVAGGLVQHVRDDYRFHKTRAFFELSVGLARLARGVLGREDSFRSGFLGHLLVELLLDASLVAEQPARLESYYRVLDAVDPAAVQGAVNRMAPRPTERLAVMISEFRRLRILWDYLEDGKLMRRLSQVMRRVKLPELPEGFREMLPEARRQVGARRSELLEGIPAATL